MVQRMQDAEEAQRWKRKFLDALEDHEQREKLLTARVRLLRRGLLGVSLAGDGHDSRLDKQLADLRTSLRHDDRETGLERLLEQIEQSVIRLDSEKSASGWALQQAFNSCLAELGHLPLPGTIRKQLKKFSANLPVRLQDSQQHPGLIRQFMEILTECVQIMRAREESSASGTAEARTGFWRGLFATDAGSTSQPSTDSYDTRREPDSDNSHRDIRTGLDVELQEDSEDKNPSPIVNASVRTSDAFVIESHEIDDSPEQLTDTDEAKELDLQKEAEPQEAVTLEGELIRDRSGLSEPAFSFIAGHVEPLLLRMLESIHITGESVALADAIRRSIVKGLHWYDFVAVLEQILQILRNAADEQRSEFQDFLNEITVGLTQVQAFVDSSKRHTEQTAASDAAMDAHVREQIEGIKTAVEDPNIDLMSMKESVQSQLIAIIQSLDGFKLQRTRQDDTLADDMRSLLERIGALEHETRELRLHLARQQESALKDALTELPNREAYNLRLRQHMDTWRHGSGSGHSDSSLCLAVADVDFFKNINDSYGHLAGDKVLKIIARELVSRLRDKDFVARYGGEEFVIIMPDTRPADAEHTLNKLRLAIAAIPFHFKERQIQITISLGVVAASDQDSAETLFERADRALYHAKKSGRNQVFRERA